MVHLAAGTREADIGEISNVPANAGGDVLPGAAGSQPMAHLAGMELPMQSVALMVEEAGPGRFGSRRAPGLPRAIHSGTGP